MTTIDAPARGWRAGPLANRNFQLLAAGQLTSTVGDLCYAVALPWLVLAGHGSPALLGTVLACYGVPRTVLIPVGGMLVDKIGSRAIMLTTDIARCALVAVLVVAAIEQTASLVLLAPVAALLGAGEGAFLPASFTIMPALLPPGQLAAGNGLSTAATQMGQLAGPVLGGVLVAAAGSAPAFAVDAATFGVSALTLAFIRVARTAAAGPGGPASTAAPAGPAAPAGLSTPADPDPPASPGTPASTGNAAAPADNLLQLVRRERLLQVILGLAMIANVAFAGAFEVALPALAHASFGAGGYGALVACIGAGGVLGTLAATRGNRLSRPAVTSCLTFVVQGLAAALVPFLGGLPGACGAAFAIGICNGFANIVMITLLQQWAPPALLGRVMSLIMLAAMGMFPVSVAVSGVAVREFGPRPFFPVAGAVLGVAALLALTQRVLRAFGQASQNPAAQPAEAT
ncbi:MAG TPA: MFS transporter [Streptosporangiaceae bacterium]